MTLAEQIKSQINIEKELPTLRNTVLNKIKEYGRYCVICDTHIKNNNPGWALQYKYWTPICEWATKEGLKTSVEFNNYGVRHLIITL